MDILIIVLMVIALLLFIGSRYQLMQTRERLDAHDHMKEMRDSILKYTKKGKTRAETIDAIMRDYGLEQREADYMYDRVKGDPE
ncbi:hypothetical protein ACFOLA_08105 [Salinicoccus hispanicus]|uniref:Uncharacterized protein n=1 Tax=Salinicoccus hispanicus TaxID=157225 RepID=A0A6N8U0F6_9STAP|nr:hypothetical protein [Salinicoccus hispanicus]MXQ51718.1 hypothetical protein [Salinicoccus hispanicus]